MKVNFFDDPAMRVSIGRSFIAPSITLDSYMRSHLIETGEVMGVKNSISGKGYMRYAFGCLERFFERKKNGKMEVRKYFLFRFSLK